MGEDRMTDDSGSVSRMGLLQARIAELVAEGDGNWAACTGCQESEEGHVSERDYPYSSVFQCQPGGGCGECGGIGVVWHDRGYYDWSADEAAAIATTPDPTTRLAAPAEVDARVEVLDPTTVRQCADYLRGCAGGHYMAQSCADALLELIGEKRGD